ncbi:hypothetical protein ACF08N_36245 [Streptomyces sp. NPDC015127]|uniref:hypothetical protein n=1 Tax=Streptomyces sp. NPDC015127 TaxID=3364939 RepID=UPI0036FB9A28
MDKLAVQMDSRKRKLDGASTTVAALAEAEPLLDLPTRPFPAELEQTRIVSPQGLLSFAGNHYCSPNRLMCSVSQGEMAKFPWVDLSVIGFTSDAFLSGPSIDVDGAAADARALSTTRYPIRASVVHALG